LSGAALPLHILDGFAPAGGDLSAFFEAVSFLCQYRIMKSTTGGFNSQMEL
jgi:hypothetical protein